MTRANFSTTVLIISTDGSWREKRCKWRPLGTTPITKSTAMRSCPSAALYALLDLITNNFLTNISDLQENYSLRNKQKYLKEFCLFYFIGVIYGRQTPGATDVRTNAAVERVFPLRNDYWNSEKSQLSVKTTVVLTVKFNMQNQSCSGVATLLDEHPHLAKNIHSEEK
ncbi:uncharacterized protein LOC128202088 isoform X1 [Galleria mellonella]|uniref:Uncharacterized protein LOC128202088 isoform X1 n=1 Tax=Galleria mellonella TaxID=7137 RepID=A0ABM3N0U7_GALME|nr:uncharacterized protein LOC128202088 isoform X1 [Galleria mellonella]